MDSRINYYQVAEKPLNMMIELEGQLKRTPIERKLRELIKIYVSQMNGCAYCIGTHTKDAKKMGVSEEEIYLLHAWRETNIYPFSYKLAFELAEHLTFIATKGISNNLYERVRSIYDEEEYTALVLIINQINAWNRLSISMGNQYLVQ